MSAMISGRVSVRMSLLPLQVAPVRREALAAEARLIELVLLDHGAHGAIEHHDALVEQRASGARCACAARSHRAGRWHRARPARALLRPCRCRRAARRHRGSSGCTSSCVQLLGRCAAHGRPRAQPERVADGIGEFGAVQRVEMEFVHAVARQRVHLLDGDARGDQAARLGILIEPAKALLQPRRDGRAAARGEAQHLREARDRQDARHDRRANARGGAASRKRRKASVS